MVFAFLWPARMYSIMERVHHVAGDHSFGKGGEKQHRQWIMDQPLTLSGQKVLNLQYCTVRSWYVESSEDSFS
jgi:hypothetical protein